MHCNTVIPIVEVSSHRTSVGPGCDAILTCTVTRAHPMVYTYSWTHRGTTLTNQTSAVLIVPSFSARDVGNYSCRVRNDAGVGMGSITIQLGGEEE